MSKMINKLCLKQTIIRRFVNEINDSDEENSDEDVKIIGSNTDTKPSIDDKDCHQLSVCFESTTQSKSPNNKRFTNLKVYIRSCGERVERVVNLNSDLNPLAQPFELKTNLDQLIGCRDLKQFENILLNANKSLEPNKTKKTDINDPKTHKSSIGSDSDINALEAEGIRKIKSKSNQLFKCFVCDLNLTGVQKALKHSKSDKHSKKTFGDDLKGIDALFTIDSESIGDVEIAIARKTELKKISLLEKLEYSEHGIRLKDGFGIEAYICSKCNLSFESLSEVSKHIQSLKKVSEESTVKEIEEPIDSSQQMTPNSSKLDQRLKSEGINSTESSDEYKFYCYFCNIYFDCKKTVVSHINDPRHQKAKRGENLNEIDAKFTVQSDLIDEFEVAFTRKNVLKKLLPKTKIDFTNQLIRLKDGIGLNAFICEKCNQSIESIEEIESHIKSFTHLIQ